MSIKFTQACPTCGRRIDVRASLLGCTVACQHCGAEFTAGSTDTSTFGSAPGNDLLARVETALRRAEEASLVQAEL